MQKANFYPPSAICEFLNSKRVVTVRNHVCSLLYAHVSCLKSMQTAAQLLQPKHPGLARGCALLDTSRSWPRRHDINAVTNVKS